MKENFVPRGELLTTEKKKRQMISDILDTDYTDCTVVFIYCNSAIRVIRV